MKPYPFKKALSWTLSLALLSQTVLVPLSEASIWEERKSSNPNRYPQNGPMLASLPSQFSPTSFLENAPALKTTLSAPSLKKYRALSKTLNDIIQTIPLSHSRIEEVYEAKGSQEPPTLILQDIHLNAEAQRNIAVALQTLIDGNQVGVVGVEGAFDILNFEPIRSLEGKESTKKVADAFLDNELLAAPSYVGITSQKTPPIFLGVDDEESHRANVDAYLEAQKSKSKIQNEVGQSIANLTLKKKQTFNKKLLEFDQLKEAYHQNKVDMGTYLKRLVQYEAAIQMSIEQFLEAWSYERKLDFNRVKKERKVVIERLAKKLDKEALSSLLAISLGYKMGRVNFGDYYANLKELCKKNGIDLKKTPAFDDYIRYVLLSDGLNVNDLLQDIDHLEKTVIKGLIKNEEERILSDESEFLTLARKLIEFELMPLEWERYKELRAWSLAPGEQKLKTSPSQALGPRLQALELTMFERFYKEAEFRSEIMVKNLTSHSTPLSPKNPSLPFKEKISKPRALVTGGFHTPDVARLLKKQKTSYVVISPKLTEVKKKEGTSYLSLFAQEKTPLEKLFAGKKLFVNPPHGNISYPRTRVQFIASQVHHAFPNEVKEFDKENKLVVADQNPDESQFETVEPLDLGEFNSEFSGLIAQKKPTSPPLLFLPMALPALFNNLKNWIFSFLSRSSSKNKKDVSFPSSAPKENALRSIRIIKERGKIFKESIKNWHEEAVSEDALERFSPKKQLVSQLGEEELSRTYWANMAKARMVFYRFWRKFLVSKDLTFDEFKSMVSETHKVGFYRARIGNRNDVTPGEFRTEQAVFTRPHDLSLLLPLHAQARQAGLKNDSHTQFLEDSIRFLMDTNKAAFDDFINEGDLSGIDDQTLEFWVQYSKLEQKKEITNLMGPPVLLDKLKIKEGEEKKGAILYPSNSVISHQYPSHVYLDAYLRVMFGYAKLIRSDLIKGGSIDKQLERIAGFYQYGINAHFFPVINNSLMMNMVNAMLEFINLEGIEHGKLDLLALKLNPNEFNQVFKKAVVDGQKQKSHISAPRADLIQGKIKSILQNGILSGKEIQKRMRERGEMKDLIVLGADDDPSHAHFTGAEIASTSAFEKGKKRLEKLTRDWEEGKIDQEQFHDLSEPLEFIRTNYPGDYATHLEETIDDLLNTNDIDRSPPYILMERKGEGTFSTDLLNKVERSELNNRLRSGVIFLASSNSTLRQLKESSNYGTDGSWLALPELPADHLQAIFVPESLLDVVTAALPQKSPIDVIPVKETAETDREMDSNGLTVPHWEEAISSYIRKQKINQRVTYLLHGTPFQTEREVRQKAPVGSIFYQMRLKLNNQKVRSLTLTEKWLSWMGDPLKGAPFWEMIFQLPIILTQGAGWMFTLNPFITFSLLITIWIATSIAFGLSHRDLTPAQRGSLIGAGLIFSFPFVIAHPAFAPFLSWALHLSYNFVVLKTRNSKFTSLKKIARILPLGSIIYSGAGLSSGNSKSDPEDFFLIELQRGFQYTRINKHPGVKKQIGEDTLLIFRSIFLHPDAWEILDILAKSNEDFSNGFKTALKLKALKISKEKPFQNLELTIKELKAYKEYLEAAELRYGLFDTIGTEYELMLDFEMTPEEISARRHLWDIILFEEFGEDEHIEFIIPPSHSWVVQEEIRGMLRDLGFIPENHPWASRHINTVYHRNQTQLKGFRIISSLIMLTSIILNVSEERIKHIFENGWFPLDADKGTDNDVFKVNGNKGVYKVRDQTGNTTRMEYRATDDLDNNSLRLIHIIHGLTQQAIRTAWKFRLNQENEDIHLEEMSWTQLELKLALALNRFFIEIEKEREGNEVLDKILKENWFDSMGDLFFNLLNEVKNGPNQEPFRKRLRALVEEVINEIENEILDNKDGLLAEPATPEDLKKIPIIRFLIEQMTPKRVFAEISSGYLGDEILSSVNSSETSSKEENVNQILYLMRNLDIVNFNAIEINRFDPSSYEFKIKNFETPKIDFSEFYISSQKPISIWKKIFNLFPFVFSDVKKITINGVRVSFHSDGSVIYGLSRLSLSRLMGKTGIDADSKQLFQQLSKLFGLLRTSDNQEKLDVIADINQLTNPLGLNLSQTVNGEKIESRGKAPIAAMLSMEEDSPQFKWLIKKIRLFRKGFSLLRIFHFWQIKRKIQKENIFDNDAPIAGDHSAGQTRASHLEFHEIGGFKKVILEIASELGIEPSERGEVDLRGFLATKGNEFSNEKTTLRLEEDGILVIIDSRFKKDHAGRGRRTAFASSEAKARHEVAELRAWRDYGIQKGILSEEEWEKGLLGQKLIDWANGIGEDLSPSEKLKRINEVKDRANQFHILGLAAEKGRKNGLQLNNKEAVELFQKLIPNLGSAQNHWDLSLNTTQIADEDSFETFRTLLHVGNDMIEELTLKDAAQIINKIKPSLRIKGENLIPKLELEYVGSGSHKIVFKATFHTKTDPVSILLAVKREWDENDITVQETASLKKLNGRGVPRFGKRFVSKDGRVWFLEEFIEGPTIEEIKQEGLLTDKLKKALVATLLLVSSPNGGLNGFVPKDFNRNNFIYNQNTNEVVMVDIGIKRLQVLGKNASERSKIFLLAGLIKQYGEIDNIDSAYPLYEAFLENEHFGLSFLKETERLATDLGIERLAETFYKKGEALFYFPEGSKDNLTLHQTLAETFLKSLRIFISHAEENKGPPSSQENQQKTVTRDFIISSEGSGQNSTTAFLYSFLESLNLKSTAIGIEAQLMSERSEDPITAHQALEATKNHLKTAVSKGELTQNEVNDLIPLLAGALAVSLTESEKEDMLKELEALYEPSRDIETNQNVVYLSNQKDKWLSQATVALKPAIEARAFKDDSQFAFVALGLDQNQMDELLTSLSAQLGVQKADLQTRVAFIDGSRHETAEDLVRDPRYKAHFGDLDENSPKRFLIMEGAPLPASYFNVSEDIRAGFYVYLIIESLNLALEVGPNLLTQWETYRAALIAA